MDKIQDRIYFEELPDGTRIITVKGKNDWGLTYIKQEFIAHKVVFEALKKAILK